MHSCLLADLEKNLFNNLSIYFVFAGAGNTFGYTKYTTGLPCSYISVYIHPFSPCYIVCSKFVWLFCCIFFLASDQIRGARGHSFQKRCHSRRRGSALSRLQAFFSPHSFCCCHQPPPTLVPPFPNCMHYHWMPMFLSATGVVHLPMHIFLATLIV